MSITGIEYTTGCEEISFVWVVWSRVQRLCRPDMCISMTALLGGSSKLHVSGLQLSVTSPTYLTRLF